MTEGSRGEGGLLINKDGYRYLQDYGLGPPDPWPRLKAMELGPRDRLSQAFCHLNRRTQAGPAGPDDGYIRRDQIHERMPPPTR
jgi:succinate dehydrogenase flavoprotein subunit